MFQFLLQEIEKLCEIIDEQSNEQVIMNMDFANDTRHMKEKWAFKTSAEEDEFLKTQENAENKCSLSFVLDQISDFKIDD